MKNTMKALARAIEICGGQHALARAVNKRISAPTNPIKQQNVWHWLNKSYFVPSEYCVAIEGATGDEVTREQLRPDVFPQ